MNKVPRIRQRPAYTTDMYRDERHVLGEGEYVSGCRYQVRQLYGVANAALVDYYEEIDSVNSPSTWNSCTHYKVTYDHSGSPARFVTESGSNWFVRVCDIPSFWFANWNPPPNFRDGGVNALTPSFGDISSKVHACNTSALRSMLPGLKSNLSLVNTLYEFKDMRTLRTSGNRIRTALDLLRPIFIKRAGIKGYLRGTLRRLVRLSADQLLQQQFNVQPLVSDIVGFYNALVSYKAEVSRLLQEQNRVLTRHYGASLDDSFFAQEYSHAITGCPLEWSSQAAPSVWTAYDAATPGWGITEAGYMGTSAVSYRTRYNATVECIYDLSAFQAEHAQTLGLLDKLGVNLNPAIVWNALPWSFVVDWFVGVSQWLDGFKTRNIEPRTVIQRFCWSVKIERSVTHTVSHSGTAHNVAQTALPMGGFKDKIYLRQVCDPASLRMALEASGMSLNEFILAGALLATRGRPN